MYHHLQFPICHHRFLKLSTIASHMRHGHTNILSLRNLISSATDSLSYLSSFPNCDDTKMYYIMFFSEANNILDVIGRSISGTDIA